MKKLIIPTLATIAMFMGTANAQSDDSKNIDTETKKVLVVYYSLTGNTKQIAEYIKEATNGDIFEIETIDTYPSEYKSTTEQAKKEIKEGYKPAIKSKVNNINDYEIVFIGSPCWWSTIAPAVSTFLTEHDLSNKTVIPFSTHGGSGLANNAKDTAKLTPNSNVLNGKAFRGGNVTSAKSEVFSWIKDLNL